MINNIINNKIVVFDLDETLGSFTELGIFWDALENFYGHKMPNDAFITLLDIFSDFLRPDIINILKFIVDKRDKGECSKIMIYTNNNGPKSWVKLICDYFDKKLNTNVFDKIIRAFKIDGKIVEICRKTHNKTVEDLINCSKIPDNTKICFIDDQVHPDMEHENVYYIKIKPYNYNLPYDVMAKMYYNKEYKNINKESSEEEFINTIVKIMNRYNYEDKYINEMEIDKIVSKQIINYLKDFFSKKKHKTIKKKHKTIKPNNLKNKTLKKVK
jgi:hypothetical protein|tara:strand:+ start:367 stop:1179 length:813 start_codon:yes stop_codon:yes gene_type:complete